MLEKEVQEFGRRLGLGRLNPPPAGPLALTLTGLGELSLEALGDGDFLISLAVPQPHSEPDRLVRALRLCAPDQGRPWPLACGQHRDHLIFWVRLSQAGLTAAELENAARFLIQMTQETR